MATPSGKREGEGLDETPETKKSKLRFLELYRQLENDDFKDAFIFVASCNKKLNIHKAMVEAASPVIRTQFNPRWESSSVTEPLINLPEDCSLEAAKAFIKILYVDTIDASLSLETVLEVASLCDMFLISDVMETCNDYVIEKIDKGTCLLVQDAYENFQGNRESNKTVTEKVNEVIARNLDTLLAECFPETWSPSNWKAVLNLESPKMCEIEELKLFQAFLQWRDSDLQKRDNSFQELLPLVRFPLMSLEEIAEKVIPTGALLDKDIVDLFALAEQAGGIESEGRCVPRFPRFSRKQKFVENSKQLETLLSSCVEHDNFLLAPKDFFGDFNLRQNKIKICGSGQNPQPQTRIVCKGLGHNYQGSFVMETSDSVFTNLKFVFAPVPTKSMLADTTRTPEATFCLKGCRNNVSNLGLKSTKILISGNFNTISDSTLIFVDSEPAITIHVGKENVLKSLVISKSQCGIRVEKWSRKNVLNNIKLMQVTTGILINDSHENEIRNVSINLSGERKSDGVIISGGFSNKILGLRCSPTPTEITEGNTCIGVKLINGSRNSFVKNFTGLSLLYGVCIMGESSENILEHVYANDSNIGVVVLESDKNSGKGMKFEYSKAFIKKASDLKAVLVTGNSNRFEDIVISTQNNDDEEDNAIIKFWDAPTFMVGNDNAINFELDKNNATIRD